MAIDQVSRAPTTIPSLEECDQQVSDAYAEGDVTRLVKTCDIAELVHAMHNRLHPFPAIHLLSLLASRDLVNARYLWRRTPKSVRDNDGDVSRAWKVGSALWIKDWPAVYEALEVVQFSERIRSLVEKLVESTRTLAAELIEKSYEVLSLADAGQMLGMAEEKQVREYCAKHRLQWEIENGFVKPNRSEIGGQNGVLPDRSDSLKQLKKMTEQIVRLHTS